MFAPVWRSKAKAGEWTARGLEGRVAAVCAPRRAQKRKQASARIFREANCRFAVPTNEKPVVKNRKSAPKPTAPKCLQVKARRQACRAVPSNPRSAGIFPGHKAGIKNEGLASIGALVCGQTEKHREKQGISSPFPTASKLASSLIFKDISRSFRKWW